MKKYSIVIPVFNSEKIVGTTINKTVSFCVSKKINYEIILVNDNSTDDSWDIISGAAKNNKKITAINLLKNYGQHNAVLCGFNYASGDFVITMDDDMQNPPEEIIHLINKINEGFDLVFGKFKEKKHNLTRRLGSKIVNYLNKKIFGKPDNITLTNFRIIRSEVIKKVINYKTGFPYIPGLVLMFSNTIACVEVEHHKREIGKSNYNFFKIMQLVSRLLINYSSYPLQILTIIGSIIAGLSFIYGSISVINKLFFNPQVPGWTTIIALLSFLNGFMIIMLGLIGEYVSRILKQISSHESYHIKEVIKK